MQKRKIFDNRLLQITLERLCYEVIEEFDEFENTVILGLQPKGIFLAERIKQNLNRILQKDISLGYLDPTFHRDDFRKKDSPLRPNQTFVPFLLEDKKVLLIDDVLYTGRTVRAALDAMITFGRPAKVKLLVLINRKYSRDIPIQPDYVGMEVNCMQHEKVLVELKEQNAESDNIWIITKEEN
ncbi:MAG: bifunctional pyr operon transcriptional regulator/uracil phosphoribosyltransferase PyrR [Cytophagaceae bacterium]|nr:bifunctional pyr operon transcriptional regulator/uracil phosphoribosyltransferase PyrR [Cytophagaceae bacterium]MDW8456697.1 bifunctional pyr operon transcriptional regulator/uracil phosphoribosyltransferase PyrR [Cytophagaceae bacterium]